VTLKLKDVDKSRAENAAILALGRQYNLMKN
jgi:hypothetical protein